MLHNFNIVWQANQDGGAGGSSDSNQQGTGDNNNQSQQDNTPKDFVAWLDAQPDNVKNAARPLFETHVRDLQSAVKATRKERDDFAKQLRDATKGMEENSKLKTDFEKMANGLEEANRKADFFEVAPSMECRNAKAAYAIAVAGDLFTKAGSPDWKSIKEAAPELFGVKNSVRQRTAGSGADNEQGGNSSSMSDWIRNAAKGKTVEL